jgi:serine/threonine-protein kinase
VSPQTDVYSLGVMAYELFLEQLPFEAETAAEVMAMHLRATPPTPSELWPDVPPELEQLLLAMLAKSPDRRPTMTEVAQRLEAVRGELQRRCRVRSGPRLPAPNVRRTPSRPGPVLSATGLAATESFAWRAETRRWQYAIGGLALALSGLMLVISRAGDRAASAATAPAAIAEEAARVTPPERGPAPAAADRDDATEPDPPAAGATGEPEVQRALATSPAPVRPAVLRSIRPERSAHRAAPRTAPRVEPAHSPPALPRRGAKADPDGTLDVYQ